VHGLAEPGGPRQAEHVAGAERLGQHAFAAVAAAVVDADDPVKRPGLAQYRGQCLLKPSGAVMSDDDRGDRVHVESLNGRTPERRPRYDNPDSPDRTHGKPAKSVSLHMPR